MIAQRLIFLCNWAILSDLIGRCQSVCSLDILQEFSAFLESKMQKHKTHSERKLMTVFGGEKKQYDLAQEIVGPKIGRLLFIYF